MVTSEEQKALTTIFFWVTSRQWYLLRFFVVGDFFFDILNIGFLFLSQKEIECLVVWFICVIVRSIDKL